MNKIEKGKTLHKLKKITSKDLNSIGILWLFNIFIKLRKKGKFENIKEFIKKYYCIEENMPEAFYEQILNQMHNDDYLNLFKILIEGNIYSLISYLKYNQEDIADLEETITPSQYYNIPKRYINRIIEMLKELESSTLGDYLNNLIKDEPIWLLKGVPHYNESEYRLIAYKIYISIGLDNALELLSNKYGTIDYEKVYVLFSKLNTKKSLNTSNDQAFNNFLFDNKNLVT